MERLTKAIDAIVESKMDVAEASQFVALDEKEREFLKSIIKCKEGFLPSVLSDQLASACIYSAQKYGDQTKDQIYESASNLVEMMINIDERVRDMTLSFIKEWYYNE